MRRALLCSRIRLVVAYILLHVTWHVDVWQEEDAFGVIMLSTPVSSLVPIADAAKCTQPELSKVQDQPRSQLAPAPS